MDEGAANSNRTSDEEAGIALGAGLPRSCGPTLTSSVAGFNSLPSELVTRTPSAFWPAAQPESGIADPPLLFVTFTTNWKYDSFVVFFASGTRQGDRADAGTHGHTHVAALPELLPPSIQSFEEMIVALPVPCSTMTEIFSSSSSLHRR